MRTMKRTILFVASLFVVANLAGCASSSATVSPAQPVMTSEPASLDFILVSTTSDLGNVEGERRSFNDQVLSGLRETGLFASVEDENTTNNPGTGIKVESKITGITKVTHGARLWYGGLAGRARVVVQVNISDLGTGKQIEAFEVEGNSGNSARSGLTDEAIQRAAEQVVSEVVQINSRTARLF